MKLALTLTAMTAAAVLTGCGNTARVAEASNMPVTVEPAPDPGSVQPPHPEQFPMAMVEARRLANTLSATGVVAPDVSRTVAVNSMSSGRVVEIRARLGDEVKPGQVLLRLQSPDLSAALADFEKAQADEILARRSLERAQVLFEHGALAAKDRETAESVEAKAKVDVRNTAERIRMLGGDPERLSPVVEIAAPVGGVIVEQNIAGPAAVKSLDNSPNLFTIADLSQVWVLCDVFENDLAQVRVGDAAEVRLNAYPDRPLRARVSQIGRILDPNTRTAKVRLELANAQGLLRPGMFATAVFTSQSAVQRLVLPSTAILHLHDKDWSFRALDGGRFKRVEVQAGATLAGGMQVVTAGLAAGDRVAVNALQLATAVEK